ncbi:hypothetical protein ElyMa_001943700 [Elysia marginata]|uniref:Uncharacterized protein n=1 Tax=Elysia marginata TaxID=1093978 RepID=A0AAV4EW79_9GAST|nr:hypothetical protein ElyMa_001943700 [Elysia marginata]
MPYEAASKNIDLLGPIGSNISNPRTPEPLLCYWSSTGVPRVVFAPGFIRPVTEDCLFNCGLTETEGQYHRTGPEPGTDPLTAVHSTSLLIFRNSLFSDSNNIAGLQ